MITFYGYNKCSTCRKAKGLLDSAAIKEIDITTTPPSKSVLKQAIASGDYKITDLFNKSGEQYRELNMKEKIKKLTETEMLDLLSKNGRLVKRPIVTDGKTVTVGFKEDVFKRVWG